MSAAAPARDGRLRTGEVSWWWRTRGGPPATRAPLPGSTDVDVCIVGAGLTGLWSAYHLAEADPQLRIMVLESRFAGYGASGRNGGWLTAALAGDRERWARRHGRPAVQRLQAEMEASVRGVAAVVAAEGIDCDLALGGELEVATTAAQWRRVQAAAQSAAAWGRDTRLLGRAELDARVRVAGARGALLDPHGGRLHPAALVDGLAAAVERRGVRLHEQTPVVEIASGKAVTERGTVRAPIVLRATEGFTSALPGLRRVWLPMNSSMVVTDPLPEQVWEQIGWGGAETLGDAAHAYVYAQRTADGRIAIGGRGVPYRFGSRTDTDGSTPAQTVDALRAALTRLFPAAAGVPLAHAWSGVLAVPRDWCSTVGFDRDTGLGWAGGYVGHGVTTTHLAGRTLRDLVLRRDTALTDLPWVGGQARRWEPEPLRWLGVQGMYAAYRAADRRESTPGAAGRDSRIARVADLISGR